MPIRYSLFDPPPEMHFVADLLSDAADALLIGDTDRARELLQQADIRSLWAAADLVMNPPKGRRPVRVAGASIPVLAKIDRASVRMPKTAEERSIFQRDGYRCRYCGSRVVLKRARAILTACLPAHVPWPTGPRSDLGKHAAFYALNSVIDHVLPHSRGGQSSPDNLVTACWPCNFSKDDATLEELAIDDPRNRPPVVDAWDGLERIVRAEKSLRSAVSSGRRDLIDWVAQPKVRRLTRNIPGISLDEWVETLEVQSFGLARPLADLLRSLEGPNVRLSIGKFAILRVTVDKRSLAAIGIGPTGDVDVPWLIADNKAAFKPFAMDLAHAIPSATLYETRTMWRVDGAGAAKGQTSCDELLAASDVVRESLANLVRALQIAERAI